VPAAPPKGDQPRRQVTVQIEPDQLARLDEISSALGITRSDALQRILTATFRLDEPRAP